MLETLAAVKPSGFKAFQEQRSNNGTTVNLSSRIEG